VSVVGLTARQVRFTNKSFWRNPASAFFTFAFPLMFLVIFTSLLGKGNLKVGKLDTSLSVRTYYVVAMATFGVISACYTNIAISVSFNRDAGILKRTRGTPLPSVSYMGGRVIHATLVGLLLVVITAAFGSAFYHTSVPTGLPLLEFVATLLVGSLTFVALALALTTVVPNADASPAIVNASILPLLFLSGIFIPIDNTAPVWIRAVGKIFPVKHFADAMLFSFLGNGTSKTPRGIIHPFQLAFSWGDLLVMAIWGIFGLVVAARFFSWEPRK
jgi:ABC-2 type transport system permease protein